ncbi:MAG: hypothetical protein IID54_05065 [Proteobacteria bacterium]|nr:hypothetical protein [Pseudomonadota bacterium]
MFEKKSLKTVAAVLLASAMAVHPAAAQYTGGPYDPTDDRTNNRTEPTRYDNEQYQRDWEQYQRDLERYERERERSAEQWRNQYYAYRGGQNQATYDECERQRAGNQIGGFIIGALAGAAIGSTIARGPARGGGTALGAILGGALGTGIATNMSCQDRNLVYRTAYRGFERGRPNTSYRWQSPRSGYHGDFRVGRYYNQGSRRCATYTQTIYVRGRPETTEGYACRRWNGTWEIVS